MWAVLVLGSQIDLSRYDAFSRPSREGEIHAIAWGAVELDSLATRDERIIIAIAARDEPASAAFFSRLSSHTIGQSVLALVPPDHHEALEAAVIHADDFALWPVDSGEIAHRIGRLSRLAPPPLRTVTAQLIEEYALRNLVGCDPVFVEAIRPLPLYARSGMAVLILGETGTGKEICARALHALSIRRDQPFIAVDCSAIPDHLFENEMFGHVRGAYTDAHVEQKGLVALARRGTLFLDEIDSLSPSAQGKLLRFLQEKTYKPLGGDRFLGSDVTVIAATNCELDTAIREKRFRCDLYYRLNVLQIRLPPLRARSSDIPLLARHFLEDAAARIGVERTLSLHAIRKLMAYQWPGNVRELSNVVQRAAVLCTGPVVLPSHVEITGAGPADDDGDVCPFRIARGQAIQAFERAYVQNLLARHAGNVSRAAREARQERRAFGRLVKKYDLGARSR